MSNRSQAVVGALLFLSLAFTVLIYWPGLQGVFLVDDTYNLELLNQYGGVTDWKSFREFVFDNPSGPLGRSVSMLSFLLNDQYYPGDVSSYRYTNLMVHCLCGLLMFWLLLKVLHQLFGVKSEHLVIALVATVWWLVSPFNVSTTLYIIQRMAQLATLFSLVGLLFYMHGRVLVESDPVRGALTAFFGLYIVGLLALFSKESGALIFLYALALELAFRAAGKPSHKYITLLVLVPVAIILAYMGYRLFFGSDSSVRNFTNYERLLTELRILWVYLFKAVMPAVGKMGLVHDDFPVSFSLLNPFSTLVALAAHVSLLVVAWVRRKQYPLLLLAVVWFYGGHLMESTVIPLELYFEHRNYMPIMAVYFVITYWVWSLLGQRKFYRASLLLLISVSALVCAQRAILWSKPFALFKVWAHEHPESIRGQTMYARSLLVKHDFEGAFVELNRLRDKWPQAIHLDYVLLDQACRGNIPLAFSMIELQEKMAAASYYGSLVSSVENLRDAFEQQRCVFLDAELMHRVYQSVDTFKYVIRPVKAKFAFWDSHLYVQERMLGRALEAADRAYSYEATPIVLMHKAILLASAGLYGPAQAELEKGLAMESSKSLHKRRLVEKMTRFNSEIEKIKLIEGQ